MVSHNAVPKALIIVPYQFSEEERVLELLREATAIYTTVVCLGIFPEVFSLQTSDRLQRGRAYMSFLASKGITRFDLHGPCVPFGSVMVCLRVCDYIRAANNDFSHIVFVARQDLIGPVRRELDQLSNLSFATMPDI